MMPPIMAWLGLGEGEGGSTAMNNSRYPSYAMRYEVDAGWRTEG
jgi:hypothetical protein